jgi:cytoskeleton protein RodZ
MPTIGETLREARMRRHLDIADVESRTKIRAKYLRALENEEFGMLPGPTFVKTFLRTYAEMLGLDPHPLVEEYRATYERRDELDVLQTLGPQAAARDRRRRGLRLGPGSALILALAAVVAALVAVGLVTGDDDDGGTPEPTVAETERQRAGGERQRPAAPRRVRLRIAPTTPTYVCVDKGAGTSVTFEGILDAPQMFRGRRLRVNLGKTDVELRANGRRVPLATGPDPVGFVFRPRSTRPLPPAERPCV